MCVATDLSSVPDIKEAYVKHYHTYIIGIGLLGMILFTGCASKGKRIDLKVPMVSGVEERL